MFNTEITSKVYELKEKLINSREYLAVKEKEKVMEEKCSKLLLKYNYLFNEYNEAIRFKDYGSDVKTKQRQLSECKKELDTNEYVKEYRKAYKEVSFMLAEIQKIIFKDIIDNKNIEIL